MSSKVLLKTEQFFFLALLCSHFIIDIEESQKTLCKFCLKISLVKFIRSLDTVSIFHVTANKLSITVEQVFFPLHPAIAFLHF